MSSKRPRIKRASNASPLEEYNKFITLEASRRYTLVAISRSFIKEKGSEHTDDLFMVYISIKGLRELFKPPKPTTISIVREFYANLANRGLKRV